MKPPPLAYTRPESLEEALSALDEDDAKVLAGGQSLVPALNMRLVGSNDLQGRSAYQPTIAHQGDRYIAYIGHHGGTPDVPKPMNPLSGQAEFNGTSIVDVTDPALPKYLKHIPGLEGNYDDGGGQMTRVCPGRLESGAI